METPPRGLRGDRMNQHVRGAGPPTLWRAGCAELSRACPGRWLGPGPAPSCARHPRSWAGPRPPDAAGRIPARPLCSRPHEHRGRAPGGPRPEPAGPPPHFPHPVPLPRDPPSHPESGPRWLTQDPLQMGNQRTEQARLPTPAGWGRDAGRRPRAGEGRRCGDRVSVQGMQSEKTINYAPATAREPLPPPSCPQTGRGDESPGAT